MSLVLEALRRVEKPDPRTGSVGATIASYRPARRKSRALVPLVLGLGTGGLAVAFFGPQGNYPASPAAPVADEAAPARASSGRTAKGRAGLPPPIFPPPSEVAVAASRAIAPIVSKPSPPTAPSERPLAGGLILQAISERDSHPIAIINDQLVKEGDLLGKARVLRIDSDSVEVLLENGTRDTVRFAPPPRPEPTPTP